jgi:hypothetical protein
MGQELCVDGDRAPGSQASVYDMFHSRPRKPCSTTGSDWKVYVEAANTTCLHNLPTLTHPPSLSSFPLLPASTSYIMLCPCLPSSLPASLPPLALSHAMLGPPPSPPPLPLTLLRRKAFSRQARPPAHPDRVVVTAARAATSPVERGKEKWHQPVEMGLGVQPVTKDAQ